MNPLALQYDGETSENAQTIKQNGKEMHFLKLEAGEQLAMWWEIFWHLD